MSIKKAAAFLQWYFRLPTISRSIGVSDNYHKGHVRQLDFYGELTVVWVEFKTMTKAYSYK